MLSIPKIVARIKLTLDQKDVIAVKQAVHAAEVEELLCQVKSSFAQYQFLVKE